MKNKLTPDQKLELLKQKQLARDDAAKKVKDAVAKLEKEIADKKAKAEKALEDEHRKDIINVFNKYGALNVSCLDIEAWLKSKGFLPPPSKKGSKTTGSAVKKEKSATPDVQEEFF